VQATALAGPRDANRSVPPPYRSVQDTYAAAPVVRRPEPRLPREGRGLTGPLLAFLGLLAVVAIIAVILLTNNSLTGRDQDPVTVPNVVGQSIDDAQATLGALDLQTDVDSEANDAAVDTVLSQDPGADATARQGDTVRLTVSAGPGPITLDDYTGRTADAAASALRGLGLSVTTTQASNNSVDQGSVISQSPRAGAQIAKGGSVTLTVSTGPQQVEVPDVVGFTESTAAQELSDANLRTSRVQENSDQTPGTVIRTDPGSGTRVDRGTTVTIVVSSGPAPTTTTTSSTTTSSSTTTTTAKRNNGNG